METPENYDDIGSMILKFQSSLDEMKKMNRNVHDLHDLHDLLLRINDTVNDTESYMEFLFKEQVPDFKKSVSQLTKAEEKLEKFNRELTKESAENMVNQPLTSVQTENEKSDSSQPVLEGWQDTLQTYKDKAVERETEDTKNTVGLQELSEQMKVLKNENTELKARLMKLEQMIMNNKSRKLISLILPGLFLDEVTEAFYDEYD